MTRLSIFILSLIFVFNVFAQGPKHNKSESGTPKPLFKHPVKVDRSGRPLYNTWQKQEHERKIRFEQRQMMQNHPDNVPALDSSEDGSLYETNAATSETSTTPSSAITNRPIQVQEDPELMGNEENVGETN